MEAWKRSKESEDRGNPLSDKCGQPLSKLPDLVEYTQGSGYLMKQPHWLKQWGGAAHAIRVRAGGNADRLQLGLPAVQAANSGARPVSA